MVAVTSRIKYIKNLIIGPSDLRSDEIHVIAVLNTCVLDLCAPSGIACCQHSTLIIRIYQLDASGVVAEFRVVWVFHVEYMPHLVMQKWVYTG